MGRTRLFKVVTAVAMLAWGGGGAGAGGAAAADDKVKVGFVYVGPVSDHGWSYQHDQGRLAVEKELGDKVSTSYVENVPEGADTERVIEQLVASGHKLIFTTSFGFMNPTVKAAQRHGDVKFEHATGYKRAANLATYASRFYEGRTVLGTMAGRLTRSNIIGYIGSYPIPEVVSGINAFTVSLRAVNPKAEVRVIWVNSWYDPGREAEAAKALIDQGADIIAQHTDSPAPVQVAQDRGVWSFGQSSDMTRFGPKSHLTAIVDDWGGYYVRRVKALLDGSWTSTDTWGGLKDGMLHLAPLNPALPAEVVAEAGAITQAVRDGSRLPFQGPIKDQSGKEVLAADKALTDDQILKMDWFVEGVIGKLPK
jgi:simple sugar transport system substrate-binding protein